MRVLAFGSIATASAGILPPGVSTGISAARLRDAPVVVNLMAPEESAALQASDIDSALRGEKAFHVGMEENSNSAKQRVLTDEINKIHGIVARARHSFLGLPKADYQVVLHESSESASDVRDVTNALLKVEARKFQQAQAAFAADKAALLRTELARIHSRRSFLEPFVPPIAFQDTWQAAMPNVINIHYGVPGSNDDSEAFRATSFLTDMPKTEIFFEKESLPTIEEARYQTIFARVRDHIKADFELAKSGKPRTSFVTSPEFKVMVENARGDFDNMMMARLRDDAYRFAEGLVRDEVAAK